jgi:hypothetical protein
MKIKIPENYDVTIRDEAIKGETFDVVEPDDEFSTATTSELGEIK